MSFYSKGNAHRIPAMASKSCNALSSRDLFVPLSATVNTNLTNRTFSIVITAYCYFGTRININNIFHDMSINGQSVAAATVNAWVSATEPGKQIATLTINGDFNNEGKPSIAKATIPFSGSMTYYKDIGCTETKEMPFFNEIEVTVDDIEPHYTQPDTPVIDGITSLDDALLVDLHTTSFGEGGGKYLYVEYSKKSNFSTVKTSNQISTLSGTVRINNLQRNTTYYVRAVAANNGMSATGAPQSQATLAASELTKILPSGYKTFKFSGMNYLGGNANTLDTEIQCSYDGGQTWTTMFHSSAPVFEYSSQEVSGNIGDTILFRTQTTTASGVFTSGVQEATIPGTLCGYVTNIVPASGTQAAVSFTAKKSTASGNITATLYYRPYGMEEEWVSAGSVTMSRNQTKTITINDLIPNYAEYEVSLNFKDGSVEYDTEPVQFFTIPVQVHNDTCDSLDYLVQLICQTLNAIKQGNIAIYMNNDTKAWCEGEDGIPTVATIMSRVNRYMHTVGCLLCSMEGFLELLKESDTNQIFMGKLGWVDCDDEPIDGSVNPVLSKGIYDAIEELIRQVWHYMGNYDYFGKDLADLQSQTPSASGATGVVGDTVYTWNGSSWTSARAIPHEDFGVIHINSGKYAGQAYYWFVNDWNRLDANLDEIKARLDALESLVIVHSFDNQDYLINVQEYGLSDASYATLVPTSATRETVIILTQDIPANDYVEVITAESSGNYDVGGN